MPHAIQLAFTARWMKGAVSIEWLEAHPDWYDTIDICATAHSQYEAQAAKDARAPSPS